MGVISDEDVARGIQRGRRGDLALLVERYHAPLLGYLYRLTGGERALSEDLTQEAFVRVLRYIGQYQYPRPFKPWLYQIATNTARDHFKRADQRRTSAVPDDTLFEDEADKPEETAEQRDVERQVVAAVSGLPEHQRLAVILRYYQGLSLIEIAAALDVPVGTVKSRLSLALARLRDVLKQQEYRDESE
jgi:RNA polymerase sigma-70 factor (ECF subfamily)